jgi:hypothetical protein
MDQIEGGTLMVNRAQSDGTDEEEKKPVEGEEEEERNLNAIDGIEAGWKLAQVSRCDLVLFPISSN